MKNTGFGYDHYTLTCWESEADLRAFARAGAHLEAMKESARLATEIRVFSFPSDKLPNWHEVKTILQEKGKVLRY